MDTPVRKYQKQKDYQRHKLFRKMKRRRRAAIEQAKDAPMKQLRRKLKIPKFEDGKDNKPLVDRPLKPNIFRRSDGSYFYQADPNAEEIDLTPLNTGLSNDPSQWTYTDAAGKIYTPAQPLVNNTGEITQGRKNTWYGYFTRPITKYFDELKYRANTNPSSIALQGKYTMPAIAASALLPLAGEAFAGSTIAGVPATTWANTALTAGFAGHGLNHAINEGINGWGDAAMTALEVAPLGRLARPMWNASKEGLQYAAKAADNAARYISPSYDLYRTIGETTPRTTPTLHSFYSGDLTGSGFVENVYTGSPLFEFGQTVKTSPEKAYFMRAPKDVDVLKLANGKFRHEVVGNEILPSGEVNGKFVSYGEPWQEFALGENSALYEFPVGPRRGPSLMATDWKGRPQKYSVDEVYDYMQQEEALRKELATIKETMGDDFLKQYSTIKRNLINEKYPTLKEYIDTSIYGANQTVIPNERWNFDKFLKTPFWKYSENPISGQVQKELMMRWPEAKPLETPTIELAEAARTPQITAKNAANITSKQRNTGYRTAALSVQQDAEYLTNPVLKRKFLEANENVKNGTASDSDKRFIESMKKVINTKRGAVPISEESKQEMLEYYSSKRYRDRVLKNVGDGEIADAFIDDALQTIKNTPIERNPLHPRFTKNSDVGTVEGVTLPTRTTPEGTQSVIVLNENAGQDVINHEINHAVDFANSAAIENNKRFPLKEATPSKFIQNGKPYMLDDVEPRTRAISLDMFLAKHPEFTIDDAYKSWYDPFHTNLSFNDLPIDARNFIAHYTEETGRNYFDNFYSWLLPPLLGGGTASFMLPAATDDSYDRGKDKHKIYIKPKNRGKFNALKKRTGKTTEQLTHSKNPLTRKRAIFALNSKKWKH